MKIEIGEAILTVEWVPYMKVTASAPAEGGDFEVVEWEGVFTDDEMPDLEDRAIAEAWDMVDVEMENRYSRM